MSGVGKRVIVIGGSSSGKSTLAYRLAERLDVPFIELDALFWEPGWTHSDREVFRERVRRAIEPEQWVMAGNYTGQQQDVSWPLADTIVWLDLPLRTAVRRCVARTWRRWRDDELLWGTNRENFWQHLMIWNPEKSLVSYLVKSHWRRRRQCEALLSDPQWSHITFHRFRSQEEVDRWLQDVPVQARPVDRPAAAAGKRPQ